MISLYLASIVVLMNVNPSTGGIFTVLSSKTPLVVTVGEDAIINCYLEPQMSAKPMEVKWLRNKDLSVIHAYHDGKEETQSVDSLFYGRTYLIKDEMEKGNLSLRIRNIQPADEGLYTCYFQSEFNFHESVTNILPAAIGTGPVFSVEKLLDEIQISCSSSGWYPRPEAQWLDDNKERLMETTKSVTQNDGQLYSINITIGIGKASNKKLCLIQETRTGHHSEAVISLSDSICLEKPSVKIWIILIIILAIFITGMCIGNFSIVRKFRIISKDLKTEFIKALNYQAEVKLDPETAHPELKVSEDFMHLSRRTEKENIPDNNRRFDTRLYVLGKDCLSANRNYWQVNVEGAVHWTIGVAYENVNRKGKIDCSVEGGFFVLERDNNGYKINTIPSTTLTINLPPSQIGIYYIHENGKLIFYDADNGNIIYMFKNIVTRKRGLYPFFSVWQTNESIHICSDGCKYCYKATDEGTHMLSNEKFDDTMC